MPLMVLRIQQNPVNPQTYFSISSLYGQKGYTGLHLINYYGEGIPLNPAGGPIPLFFRFRNQSELPIYGNITRGVPLLFDNNGTNTNLCGQGLPCTGDNKFNDCTQVQLEITDINGNPVAFNFLMLVFYGKDTFDPREASLNNIDLANRQR